LCCFRISFNSFVALKCVFSRVIYFSLTVSDILDLVRVDVKMFWLSDTLGGIVGYCR
jgi:hypothetical protein